ncbi:MAG: hypothetical protein M1813_005547 [Trichoglossum hirsutum]|nr:MAG: hypothetical protein M1813_005547 [Trichoglossum hirsutum]
MSTSRTELKCYNCFELEHLSQNCPKLKTERTKQVLAAKLAAVSTSMKETLQKWTLVAYLKRLHLQSHVQYTFIDTKFAKTIERFLDVTPTPLQAPLDGRRVRTPMLVIGLDEHDMILERKWFTETGILIDCKNRRLIWLDDQLRVKE